MVDNKKPALQDGQDENVNSHSEYTVPADSAQAHRHNFSKIPAVMRSEKSWVLWRYEARNGNMTKVPYQTSGNRASSTDPATWSSFEDALATLSSRSGFDGLGFVFNSASLFAGVDFDHVRDSTTGVWDEDAKKEIAALDSYAEVSPSGTGAHVIVRVPSKAHLKNRKKDGREVYFTERFFCMTAQRLQGASPEPRESPYLPVFLEKHWGAAKSPGEPPNDEPTGATDWAAILSRDVWEGDRHNRMLSIYGHLRASLPQKEAAAILYDFNENHCKPSPKSSKEVEAIILYCEQEIAKNPPKAKGRKGGQGRKVRLEDVEPWDQEVDGADLLRDIVGTLLRFVAMPEECAEAAALWILHAHTQDAFFVSPILTITSPEKRCGKTTLLSLIGAMSPRSLPFSNCTPATLFRAVEKFRPTVLIDEADTFLRGKQADPELRGLINSGHTRTAAFVLRTVGDSHEPVNFTTWAPKVISLIGTLPETVEDRSVVIHMRRRASHERTERLRSDKLSDLEPIKRKAARWAADHLEMLKELDPPIPAEIRSDRAQDNWRTLLAVADAVGGPWPHRARRAAVSLSSAESAVESYGVLLLQDIRELFEREEADRLSSSEIIRALTDLEERPWAEYYDGRPLTAPRLAKLLRPFEIIPDTIRIQDKTAKGYYRDKFTDAWGRYLGGAPQSVTPSQSCPDKDSGLFQSVTHTNVLRHEKPTECPPVKTCDGVTVQSGSETGERKYLEV